MRLAYNSANAHFANASLRSVSLVVVEIIPEQLRVVTQVDIACDESSRSPLLQQTALRDLRQAQSPKHGPYQTND